MRFSKRTKKEAQDWVRVAKREKRYRKYDLKIKKHTDKGMLRHGWKWYVEVIKK